jgi:hypothetical protein
VAWLAAHRNLVALGICALLVTITVGAYWPVHQNEFINYDDQQYITENPHVLSGLTWQGFLWAFRTGHASNWHPPYLVVAHARCAVIWIAAGAHHLMSLAFHVVNALLVFLLLDRMTGALWRSALVAGLFALHPLHVESVAWAAERKDVLSAFFGLLALLAYVTYANPSRITQQPSPFTLHAPRWYALTLIFFALGLMSKPMLVTLPFLMLLLDYWPLQRWSLGPGAWPKLLRLGAEKIPFLIMAVASSLITVLVQQKAMIYYKALPFSFRAVNAVIAYARYLGNTVWPRDLAILYPHPGDWPASVLLGSLLLLVAISAIVLRFGRTRPYLPVGWFCFLGMLVPVIGLVQVGVQALADRYTYLPLIGIFIMVVWLAGDCALGAPRRLGAVAIGGIIVLLACALRTREQVRFWRDTETVFTHNLQVTPGNWVAHHNLALLALRPLPNSTQRSRSSSSQSAAIISRKVIPFKYVPSRLSSGSHQPLRCRPRSQAQTCRGACYFG